MKNVIVRWTAFYETRLSVPDDMDLKSQAMNDAAADIPIDVPGSEYQSDTWDVQSIKKEEQS